MIRALLSATFTRKGRLSRTRWWSHTLGAWFLFVCLLPIARLAPGNAGVVVLDVALFGALIASAIRRLHDRDHSAWWLFAAGVPVFGPMWIVGTLGFRRGTDGSNRFGPDPQDDRPDYLRVKPTLRPGDDPSLVEEVTRLYRVPVFAVATPRTTPEVQEALARSNGPISIGGGRFSMGGQVASPGSLHLDMREMNRVLAIDFERRIARVQPGVRWCDLQRMLDPHGLAVSIMQTYANFTVGGSIGVNCHGRYVGLGPIVLSVLSVTLVTADGTVLRCSREEHREVFFGVVGGYGALGVVVEAELRLAENVRVEEQSAKLPTSDYAEHFRSTVRDDANAVFHNADLYLPHMRTLRSATWRRTDRAATAPRLQKPQSAYPIQRYLMWAMSETPFAGWRREHLIEPLRFATRRVHWRNAEAGYDVAELEPPSRARTTFVLQEYFVPIARFNEFVPKMAEIFRRHQVNVINVSVRHALPDDGTLLSWASEEVFAFVVYYKQRTRRNAVSRVAVWTRELIDAAIACGGRYYLPYQAWATEAQFHAAYPRAKELFALKAKLDPDFRLRGVLWDTYYKPSPAEHEGRPAGPPVAPSEFHSVYDHTRQRDRYYLFLQNIYHLYDEDRLHQLIVEATARHAGDEAIYREVQQQLAGIRSPFSVLTHSLPALAVQKAELARQVAEAVGAGRVLDGYVEVGTVGRYVNPLRRVLKLTGPVWISNDAAPGWGPVDLVERGQLGLAGTFVPLGDYAPLPESAIPSASADLLTCFIGLHHIRPEGLEPFIRSIHRVLRPGGLFLLREHDVRDPSFFRFVQLAHTVFNCGLGVPWATNDAELHRFESVETWIERLEALGFRDQGVRVRQAHDPTDNTLLAFEKLG